MKLALRLLFALTIISSIQGQLHNHLNHLNTSKCPNDCSETCSKFKSKWECIRCEYNIGNCCYSPKISLDFSEQVKEICQCTEGYSLLNCLKCAQLESYRECLTCVLDAENCCVDFNKSMTLPSSKMCVKEQ